MTVRLHPHALARLAERGGEASDVISTVEGGERFPAKLDRFGFRRNFAYGAVWRGKTYATKQVEAYAVWEDAWLVITVLVKFF